MCKNTFFRIWLKKASNIEIANWRLLWSWSKSTVPYCSCVSNGHPDVTVLNKLVCISIELNLLYINLVLRRTMVIFLGRVEVRADFLVWCKALEVMQKLRVHGSVWAHWLRNASYVLHKHFKVPTSYEQYILMEQELPVLAHSAVSFLIEICWKIGSL